jgi:hypothetical protein
MKNGKNSSKYSRKHGILLPTIKMKRKYLGMNLAIQSSFTQNTVIGILQKRRKK